MSTTHPDPAGGNLPASGIPAPGVPVARPAAVSPAYRRTRDAARPAALAGFVSCVALFVGVASLDIPRGASDEVMQAFWHDSANRTAMIVSTFALSVAGLSFLGFLAYLVRRLTAGRSETEAGIAPRLAQQAGTVYVVMLFATGLTGAIARGLVIDHEPVPNSDLLRYFAQIRYTAAGAFAMPAVAVVIGCTAYAVLRHGVLPRWLGWFSVACTAIITAVCATDMGGLAIPVVLLWTIACSIVFVRHSAAPTRVPANR